MNETTNTATKSTATFTRAQMRRLEEAQEHLASTMGAAAIPTEMRDELTIFGTREQANELLADLEAAGFVHYDTDTCLITVPMG